MGDGFNRILQKKIWAKNETQHRWVHSFNFHSIYLFTFRTFDNHPTDSDGLARFTSGNAMVESMVALVRIPDGQWGAQHLVLCGRKYRWFESKFWRQITLFVGHNVHRRIRVLHPGDQRFRNARGVALQHHHLAKLNLHLVLFRLNRRRNWSIREGGTKFMECWQLWNDEKC